MVGYTQAEYEQWLQGPSARLLSFYPRLMYSYPLDDKWTSDETNYLFSLLKEYDLRFLVIADRYAYLPKQVRAGGLAQNRYAWPLALAGRKKSAAAGVTASRRSGRGAAGFVGEEGDESRDGTPGVTAGDAAGDAAGEAEAESAEALMMGEVKRRSIEVRRGVLCADVDLCFHVDRRSKTDTIPSVGG